MTEPSTTSQILDAWRVHNAITLYLIKVIPMDGLQAVPLNSRGRTVAEQLLHIHRVRESWTTYHRSGERMRPPRVEKGTPIPADTLITQLTTSGAAVEALLADALDGRARIRSFGGNTVRWMTYLVAHESHHRGQIMLALKQNGMRMPDEVALTGLWNTWVSASGEIPESAWPPAAPRPRARRPSSRVD